MRLVATFKIISDSNKKIRLVKEKIKDLINDQIFSEKISNESLNKIALTEV